MKASLAVLTFALAMAGHAIYGSSRQGVDHPDVLVRVDLNYSQPCPSWLVSHVSGQRYCASPALAVKVAPSTPPASGPKYDESKTDQASLVAAGKEVYGAVCQACHQADGKGLSGQFPPLAGSGEFYGDAQNMARIIVHGLQGEIVVQGVTYNSAMPGQGALSDYEIAAAATYVRSSWGNADGIVLPSDVKAVR